jgi:hypothetical protein
LTVQSEDAVKKQCRKFLRDILGAKVFSTSSNKKSRCTAGTPDDFVWYRNRWYAIEYKNSQGGKLSSEQYELFKAGAVLVISSLEGLVRSISPAQ